jgi:cytochrome c
MQTGEHNPMTVKSVGTLFVALALAWAGASASTAQQSPKRRGAAIAERHCARCHSITTEGASPLAPAPPFRVLPQRYPVEQLAEALAEGIITGHPEMPHFTFTPVDIDALLTYIDSLAPDARPGPARGKSQP